ncbi:MAG: ABC transporter ATP-binding protein [Rhodospirillaceae bacterium]
MEALRTVRIDKRFGRVWANRAVSLTVAAGTIHGLVGENGAGKSTIMSIVYGSVRAEGGEIRVDGRRLDGHGPREAIAAGIGMVHQHFMLVESFSALENLMLGAEGGCGLGPGRARARAALARLGRDYGLEVPAEGPVAELPVGVRQRLEILKALHRGARLLILDEPTAVLTPGETGHLFTILRALAAEGRTVILISHKLKEIMAVTDRVTVMRRGAVVHETATAETSADRLAEAMVGQPVSLALSRPPAEPGAPVLEVEGLEVRDDRGRSRVRGLGFQVRAGEIVGIAGVSGNGQSELLEALAAMRPLAAGRVTVGGRPLPADAAAARRAGIAHVPEDRLRFGLLAALPAWENDLLGAAGGVMLHPGRAMAASGARMAAYDIRPAEPRLPAGDFSGGNQQKLVLAREIGRRPALLLVGQPTRGVDIGAVAFIHRQLLALRAAGTAILLVSAELDELLGLADRILVMFEGRIVGERPAAAAERDLGLMMAGAGGRPGSVRAGEADQHERSAEDREDQPSQLPEGRD